MRVREYVKVNNKEFYFYPGGFNTYPGNKCEIIIDTSLSETNLKEVMNTFKDVYKFDIFDINDDKICTCEGYVNILNNECNENSQNKTVKIMLKKN